MSWTASRWASQQAAGSPVAKLLLYALADLADEGGRCWPTQRALCDRTELGRRAVIDHLARLEEAGLITRERRSDAMGRAADLYTLLFDGAEREQRRAEVHAPDAPTDAPHAPSGAGGAPVGAPDAPGLVHVAHVVGAPRAYRNRLKNLPIEPKECPASPEGRRKRDDGAAEKLTEELWAASPSRSRSRSSRADLLKAVRGALDRGAEAEAVRTGVIGYLASPDALKDGGQFAKGVHRIVENDRWASFSPPIRSLPSEVDDGEVDGGEVWRSRVRGFSTSQFWNADDWGPRPGKAGCAAPIALLVEHGFAVAPIAEERIRAAG